MLTTLDPAQEALIKIKKELLKYYYERCPQRRRKELELDAAIAWRVAQHISQLLINPSNRQLYKTCIDELFDTVAFHSEEFFQLYRLLNDASFWASHLEKPKEFY